MARSLLRRCARRAAAAVLALLVAGCAARAPLPTADTVRQDPEYLRVRGDLASFDASPLEGRRIVLDPGHGGAFPGAVGKKGTREADVNLGVALYLWGLLSEAGADVLLTRQADSDFLRPGETEPRPDLAERARAANEFAPDLFLAIHHNADAGRDRRTNRTETYFKMSDPGPSLDAAIRIHGGLVGAMPTNGNRLFPGNYFVLRRSDGAAVLGEAAHISNVTMEKRLRRNETLAREAAGYFRGMADYFRNGLPRVFDMAPRDTILTTAMPDLTARIADDRGNAADPATVEMRLDGDLIAARFEPASGRIAGLAAGPVPNGEHRAELRARNVRGNATPLAAWRFRTASPPARLFLSSAAAGIPASGPLPVTALVLDAHGQAVADSTAVRWILAGTSAVSVDGPPDSSAAVRGGVTGVTRRGATTVYLEGAAGSVVIATAGATADTLALGHDTRAAVAGFCVDARDGRAVGGAWLSDEDGPPALANRDGYFAVADSAESLRVMRAGYRVRVAAPSARIALEPVAEGRLHGIRFALDPEGGGDEPAGLGPTSLRAADINLRVAFLLRSMLEAAGAEVALTRDADVPVSGLERVLRAEGFDPARYVRIAHRGRPGEPGVAVGHYPGSREGERLARDLALAVGVPARVIEDAQYVLQQTSVPAVCANLAPIADPDTERHLLSAAALREEAYTLYLGLLAHFGAPAGGDIEARIAAGRDPEDAVVSLDGHLHLVPGADGTVRFHRVQPGRHRVEAAFAGGPRWAREVIVTDGSGCAVQFDVAPPGDPEHNQGGAGTRPRR